MKPLPSDVVKLEMARAYTRAGVSPDPSSQNGAVIIASRWRATGYNKINAAFPQNYEHRASKYCYITHAEEAAIAAAAYFGLCTQDATMICPWAACNNCARLILESGISTLWVHKQRMEIESSWMSEVAAALDALRRGGVRVHFHDGPIVAPKILVSGQLWNPENFQFDAPNS